MKYTPEQLNRAKSVDIAEFLAERGINPDHQTAGELVYSSPLKEEKTPSFNVNPAKNVFHDFSTGNKGDIITLCQLLDSTNFSGAMETLLRFRGGTAAINFERTLRTTDEEKRVVIKKILPLHSQNLRNYFLYERMIKEVIAKRYLSEIHYENKHGIFYAGCWKNDAGGHEIRSAKFKGCVGKKAVSSFIQNDFVDTLSLFEGYLDFLSWLTLLGQNAMLNTDVVVLNSLALITNDLMGNWGANYERINLYFDNDEAGHYAVSRVQNAMPLVTVTDCSKKAYPNHKDFNDLLCQKPKVNANG
ncbi:MAG: toprim domain-containing protein [Spirosomataceae bacterium]